MLFFILLSYTSCQHTCFLQNKLIEVNSSVSGYHDVLIDIDTRNWTIKSNCSDINFFLGDVNLDFWVQNEECGNAEHTYFWLQLPLLIGINKIIIYYDCLSGQNEDKNIRKNLEYFFPTLSSDCEHVGERIFNANNSCSNCLIRLSNTSNTIVLENPSHIHNNVEFVAGNPSHFVQKVGVSSSGSKELSGYHTHKFDKDIYQKETDYYLNLFPKYFGVNFCFSNSPSFLWNNNTLIPFKEIINHDGFIATSSSIENRYLLFTQEIGSIGGGNHFHSYEIDGKFEKQEEESRNSFRGLTLTADDCVFSSHQHTLENNEIISDLNVNEEHTDPPAFNFNFMHPSVEISNTLILDEKMILFFGDENPPFGWFQNNDYLDRFVRHSSSSPGSVYGCNIKDYPCSHTHTIGNDYEISLGDTDSSSFDAVYKLIGGEDLANRDHTHSVTGSMDESKMSFPYFTVRPFEMKNQKNWNVSIKTCSDEKLFNKNGTECICKIGFEFTNEICKICEDGKYKSKTGNTQCKTCSDGYTCKSKLMDMENYCQKGYYCIEGIEKPCPLGTYNNVSDSPVYYCTECPRFHYCNNNLSFDPIKCDPSHYCPPGSSKQIPCECNGNGDCIESETDCNCWDDYIFADCSDYYCWGEKVSGSERDAICNNGKCNSTDFCLCEDGWKGERCDIFCCNGTEYTNYSACSSNGLCVDVDECKCVSGYSGEWCQEKVHFFLKNYACVILIGSIMAVIVLIVVSVILFGGVCSALFFLKNKNRKDTEFELEKTLTDRASFNLRKTFFSINQIDVKLIRLLGNGNYGEVYLAEWEGKIVAAKVFRSHQLCSDDNDFTDFEKELEIISSVSHPNLLQFYGCCLKLPKVRVVIEYCENGDLQDYIGINPGKLSVSNKMNIILGISSAMRYLHNRDIIHRDIKSKNILLTKSLDSKVCDFGIARVVERNNDHLTTRVGTRIYMAPEVVISKNYDEKCDVFSFSIVMWELFHECFDPFKERRDENGFINVEFRVATDPNFRPIISNEVIDSFDPLIIECMEKCWNFDPKERPGFDEIFKLIDSKKSIEILEL